MPILLPLITFFLFWAASYRATHDRSLRRSFLCASLAWAAAVAFSTEALSTLTALTRPGVSLFWLVVIAALAAFLIKIKPALPSKEKTSAPNLLAGERLLVMGITVIVLTVGLIAFVAPPNNWDSMTYHMARVAHWVQNQTAEFYPTNVPRQLWASPWAEYAIMHFQILLQSDRLANLVQWWSMIGSIIGVSLIAKTLGAGRPGQLLSAALCATLPVGILEASSTQNDYAAAFFCVSFVYFALNLMQRLYRWTAVWCALSLALGFLTKSTTAVFLLPFIGWLAYSGFQKHHGKFIKVLALIIVVPLLFNAPQFLRNYTLSGNILSLASESKSVKNETYTLQAVASNALRYLGLNLSTPNEDLNKSIAAAIRNIHQKIGWNVVDPRYSFGEEYKIEHYIHEDNTCNTALTILFIITVLLIAVFHRRTKQPEIKIYLAALLTGFFLFCFLLKWQPWGNRLLLPLAVLTTPFLGAFLSQRNYGLSVLTGGIMILLCLPWVFNNVSRPLIRKEFTIFSTSRDQQYFNNRSGLYFSYKQAIEEVKKSGCRNIALVMSAESWDYPVRALLGAPDKDFRIEHVNVDNPSAKLEYPRGAFEPCIALHDGAQGIAKISINNSSFVKTNQYAFLSVYRKDSDGSIARLARTSSLAQMIRYFNESDQVLQQAQSRGGLDQPLLLEFFSLRKLSVDYAKMLDIEELNSLYNNLGTAVRDLFIQGSTLLLDGLSEQNPGKIDQGQQLLDQWSEWLSGNMNNLQNVMQ